MAAQGLNSLQVSYAKSWANLTTDNHLSAIYAIEPQLESDIVTQIHGLMGYTGLDSFLSQYPVKMFDSDVDYRWFLKGDDRKAIMITGFDASDVTKPGIGRSRFKLKVAENYFKTSEILIFDDREYNVRVMSDGYSDGVDWVYEVEHMEPSDTFYIPASLLAAGKKVSKEGNIVTNTLNDETSGVSFNSQFEMRNVFSTHSKQLTVPGNMQDRKLLIKLTAPDGSPQVVWTKYQDLVCEAQWKKELNNQLMFSKFNQNPDGTYSSKSSNGFPIKRGAGLRQQIAPSYKFYYNTLTLDFLLEVGINLSVNILPEDKREFLIMTGERGMFKFSKMIEDKVAIFQPMGNPDRLIGSGNNLGFQGQYRQYIGPNGIKYTIMHMPEYDDPIDNRMPHPEGGFTENYRYTIMNIGTTNGQPNIQKVGVRGRTGIKWYVAGSTTPFGPQTGGAGATDVDGYKINYLTTQGIMLRNPLSACELIPNVS